MNINIKFMRNEIVDKIMDIKSIAHFIHIQKRKDVRDLKLRDLIDKCNELPKLIEMNTKQETVDIAIFVSNNMELEAFNKILKFRDKYSKEYKNINGLRIWKHELKRENEKPFKIFLIAVGEAGNISCTLACMRVFDTFDVKFSILSGIAAGLAPKYSVVFSEGVVDYEHQRLEPNNITYRPDPLMINNDIKRNITYFNHDRVDLFKNELIRRCTSDKKIDNTEFDLEQLKFVDLRLGIIASGEKLLADGITLKQLKDNIKVGKGVVAGEMEGSGFSNSCNEFSIPWVVIKGISDDGGTEKDNELNKKYQFIAALGSAIATIRFLELDYRDKNDYSEF